MDIRTQYIEVVSTIGYTFITTASIVVSLSRRDFLTVTVAGV